MMASGFALFNTAIGRCGVAWGERGVAGVQLPEAGERETRARMLQRFPAAGETAPPPEVQRVIDRLVALLRGEASDFSTIALDMDEVPAFHRRVYEAARAIPAGMTLSYGDIAARVGAPGAARAVGQALGRNPFPIIVPCHRVLAAGGKIGGFSAQGGVATKRCMLAIEGVQLNGKAAAVILARVSALFPRGVPTGARLLRIPDEKLRDAGLSDSKVLSLRDLAQKAEDGVIPTLGEIQNMADETIIERLSEVRGIGRWSAEMLLMFRLGRPDVLPVDDFGVRKGFAIAFNKGELPSPKELAAYGARWQPYRTVASWYLWRVAERASARKVMPMGPAEETS